VEKAKSHAAISVVNLEQLEEADNDDFIGMTEEEIEEVQKE